jgi:hypothetical protein
MSSLAQVLDWSNNQDLPCGVNLIDRGGRGLEAASPRMLLFPSHMLLLLPTYCRFFSAGRHFLVLSRPYVLHPC